MPETTRGAAAGNRPETPRCERSDNDGGEWPRGGLRTSLRPGVRLPRACGALLAAAALALLPFDGSTGRPIPGVVAAPPAATSVPGAPSVAARSGAGAVRPPVPAAGPIRWIPAPSRRDASPDRSPGVRRLGEGAGFDADSLERAFRREQSRLRRYPDQAGSHLRLGDIYFRVGNQLAARYHLERFLESGPTGPDSIRAALLRARALFRLERHFEATVALEMLARRHEAPPGASHDLSLLLRRDRRRAEGVMAAMRAVERSGPDPLFLREAAAQWKELRRLPEALVVLDALCGDPRATGEDQFQAGYLAHLLGAKVQARSRYEAALARDGAHAEAHYNLALLLQESGEAEEAIRHWEELIRLRPHYDPTYFQLGTLLLELQRREAAAGLFERYLEVGRDFPALLEAGGILNTLGVPPQRWRPKLDARITALADEARLAREEWEAVHAREDSTASEAEPPPDGAGSEGDGHGPPPGSDDVQGREAANPEE